MCVCVCVFNWLPLQIRWSLSSELGLCAAIWNEISLTRLVSEALIVLWLLYYLLSSRYLAPLNSFKWRVDSENKLEEQRPGGSQDLIAQPRPPNLAQAAMGVWRGRTDGHTMRLESCQHASAPEVFSDTPTGIQPQSFHFHEDLTQNETSHGGCGGGAGVTAWLWGKDHHPHNMAAEALLFPLFADLLQLTTTSIINKSSQLPVPSAKRRNRNIPPPFQLCTWKGAITASLKEALWKYVTASKRVKTGTKNSLWSETRFDLHTQKLTRVCF